MSTRRQFFAQLAGAAVALKGGAALPKPSTPPGWRINPEWRRATTGVGFFTPSGYVGEPAWHHVEDGVVYGLNSRPLRLEYASRSVISRK